MKFYLNVFIASSTYCEHGDFSFTLSFHFFNDIKTFFSLFLTLGQNKLEHLSKTGFFQVRKRPENNNPLTHQGIQAWGNLLETNTLAYFDLLSVLKKNFFITSKPSLKCYKAFFKFITDCGRNIWWCVSLASFTD